MKKQFLFLLILTLSTSFSGYSQQREIPFFGKFSLVELCGSDDCRPSYGTKVYINKKDKLYYDGD